jgi:nucleoside-diphosphate-sugar epimerase
MDKHVALVAGASGVVGRGLVEHLATLDGWEVVGLARSAFDDLRGRARFLPVDLLDPDDCRAKLGSVGDVTHIFYAAYLAQPTEAKQATLNLAMLRNLVEVVEESAPGLRHISLMEGPKAYGCHFGPYKTPAKESDPRHLPPNFYYDQEDFLRDRQQSKAWTWSALRPSLVCGPGVGHPMNMSMAIAVYASICKELGVPLWFPGTSGAYSALFEATDSVHLARAAVWAATEPRCSGEVFNITNGDLFRWVHLWPKIAASFGLEPAPPMPLRLTEMMADKEPLWNGMVQKYGLRPYPYEQVVSWPFAEFVFRIEYDIISDTTKARRYGFHDVVDTEAMFDRMFLDLRARRYIP